MSPSPRPDPSSSPCAVTRTLAALGDRWSFLILREAFLGTTRYADFKAFLGIASDVLGDRLNRLVDEGVLVRTPYHEPGQRTRHEYHLTPAGTDLKIVLAALQQWGDAYRPRPGGPTVERRRPGSDTPLRVAFVNDRNRAVRGEQVELVPTAAFPPR